MTKIVVKKFTQVAEESTVEVSFPCYVKYDNSDDNWRDYRILRRVLETGEYIEIKRSESRSDTPKYSVEYGRVDISTDLAKYLDADKDWDYQMSSEAEFTEVLTEMLAVLRPVLPAV